MVNHEQIDAKDWKFIHGSISRFYDKVSIKKRHKHEWVQAERLVYSSNVNLPSKKLINVLVGLSNAQLSMTDVCIYCGKSRNAKKITPTKKEIIEYTKYSETIEINKDLKKAAQAIIERINNETRQS